MKQKSTRVVKIFLIVILAFVAGLAFGQCPDPRLFDINLTRATSTPVWENCIDNASDPNQFNLTLISPNDIHNYTLDFGDGSVPVSGALWPANTPINHVFDLGIYTVTLSETRNGCTTTITGTVTNDRKAGAAAIPPTIGTSGCVPHTLTFINQSTNASPFTVFEWNWGDGTREIAGPETVGKPRSHVFEKGKAGCNMVVTLTAYSLCDTTFSSYGPYDFWDIDTAVVTASATRICGGQNVTFTDQTLYNCNVRQPRKIRWDFRQVGGPLTEWLPATPENRSQTYFITGNVGDVFTVFMEDSNFCGVDPAAVSVQIIGPPQAGIDLPVPTICAGDEGIFENISTGEADLYTWDFGDGSNLYTTGGKQQVKHRYNNPGTYTVKLVAAISGTALCKDSTTTTITVLPSSVSDFELDKVSGCNPLTVNITDKSVNATVWEWNLGPAGTFNSANPPALNFTNPGTYQIRLQTTNSLGCGNSKSATVNVYPSVVADAEVDSVCLGSTINFKDKSSLNVAGGCAAGNILYERWNGISGMLITDLTSNGNYPNSPSSSALLSSFEAPVNSGNNYGSRIRGFICPPQTGNYVFWIASDDHSELWLSTDANPSNKVKIATVVGSTLSRQWNKYSSQQSVPIYLEAGRRYYIEALHKEAGGDDNLAVGWQLPSGTTERPIPGNHLSPFAEGSTIQAWSWSFGDGATSNVQNPSYKYPLPGEYNVQLTVSTGKCQDTKTIPVVVYPQTQANFYQSDTAGCTPLTVRFFDESINHTKVIWNFGDGTVGEEYAANEVDTITHTFINNTGVDQIYYVSLISETEAGCADTVIKKVKVYPGPRADFSFTPSAPRCSPVDITFRNLSGTATSYKWYFGNYDSSSTNASTFNYTFVNQSGDLRFDTIILHAYSASGCYGVTEKIVTVFPEAEFQIVAEPDSACQPAQVRFTATGNPVSFNWNFGDGGGSNQVAPVRTYYNQSDSDTSYVVTFIGASAFGCRDTATKSVVIHPVPIADFLVDVSSGCSPLTVNFDDLSSGGVESIWEYGDGIIDTISTASHSYIFENKSNAVKTFTVKLKVVTSQGCISEKFRTIQVFPEVFADFSTNDSIGCSPLTSAFVNLSQGANFYNWNFGDGSNSPDQTPVHVFNNTGDRDTVFVVRLTASSSFGCQSFVEKQVNVHPVPTANFFATPVAGCSPLQVNFQNLSTGAVDYLWDFNTGETSSSDDASFSKTFTNTSLNPRNYKISLLVKNAPGCSDTISKTVTVNPAVVAKFIVSDSVGCTPLKVNFTNISDGGTFYIWDFGDGSSSPDVNPTHDFKNSGNSDTVFNVKLTASSTYGCQSCFEKQVKIYSVPTANFFVSPATGCSPLEVSFQNASIGAIDYQWDFNNGETGSDNASTFKKSFSNTTLNPLNYNISLLVKNAAGCSDTITKQVTVYPEVTAEFEVSDTAGCSPLSSRFTNLSQRAKFSVWDFGNGASSPDKNPTQIFVNNSVKDTTYKVTLTSSSDYGCTAVAEKEVVVYKLPSASFFVSPVSGCSPLSVDFQNVSTGASTFSWDFNNGDYSSENSTVFSKIFTNDVNKPVNYKIVLTAETEKGCVDTAQRTVVVFPEVNASFDLEDTVGCSPLKPGFYNYSTNASFFAWNFGDGSSSSERRPSHSFTNNSDKDTSYLITLTATSTNGCKDEFQKMIIVRHLPEASFAMTPSSGCSPLDVRFENVSVGGTNFYWNFGSGGSESLNDMEFNRLFVNYLSSPLSQNVILTAETIHGCQDTAVKAVTVYPSVDADFVLSDTAGCSPLQVNIFNLSWGNTFNQWDFGDGNQAATSSPRYTFVNNTSDKDTSYMVTLISSNSYGCVDTVAKPVYIYHKPKAEFYPDITSGCTDLKVVFTNASIGADTYNWSFGDGNGYNGGDLTVDHTFSNSFSAPETYKTVLTVATDSGCTHSYSRDIQVYPAVKADFESDPSGCTPFMVKLTNKSIGASGFRWELGDGNIAVSKDPEHVYSNITSADTTFEITLYANSLYGCSDTLKKIITVFSRPKADFTVTPGELQLPDSTAYLVNKSSPGSWVYQWDFGDGEYSSLRDPGVHYYDFYGTYQIKLLVKGGNCEDVAYQMITVKPTKPMALFTGNGDGCSPVIVQFTNSSKFADEFIWDFGDGQTSNQRNPRHVYDLPGSYTVTLKAKGLGGEDVVIMQDVVKVYPIPSAFFKVKPDDKVVKIPGNSHYFSNLSEKAVTYSWDFGDGATSSDKNPFHTYSSPGSYDVTLVATNEYGCSDTYMEQSAAIAEAGGKILVPNAFTPPNGGNLNSSNKNDYFNPVHEGVVEFHMQIFNRWGELIFETFQLQPGWDGTYRGQPCKQDVYVFKIRAKFVDGEVVEQVGDVTLIR